MIWDKQEKWEEYYSAEGYTGDGNSKYCKVRTAEDTLDGGVNRQ